MSEKPSYNELVERLKAFEDKQSRNNLYKEALRFERDRARNYLNLVQVVMVALNKEGRITLINPKGCRVLGWQESELLGKDWFTTCLPQPQGSEEIYPFFLRLMAGEVNQIEYYENPVVTRDGELRYIAWQSTLLCDEHNNITGTLSAGEDITEKRKAEEALRQSREELAEIFSMSLDMICVADIQTLTFLKVNPAFTKVLGYSEAELLNRPFTELIHPEDLEATIGVVEEKLRKGKAVLNFTNRYRCKDGDYRWLDWVSHPDVDRGVTFAVAHDITDRILVEKEKKKLEGQLLQSHRLEAIGTLAGGIAHDFNNLLMGIQGRASLLRAELTFDHPSFEHVSAIEEYVTSAADLTKQLLGMARSGKYEVTAMDINQVLSNSSEMFGRTRKELSIHARLQSDDLVVNADRGQLEQVFLNIFVNAWQAMPRGGELFLTTERVTLDADFCAPHRVSAGDYAKISITDTGVGMDEAIRRRVFDPFFTTKEKNRGTGLGLASAYGIVKNHDGIITVYSEPGHGATFNLYLPLSGNTAKTEHPMEIKIERGSESILLVDDEKIILDVGQAMLARMGYKVFAVNGGEEATRLIAEKGGTIDLVILDLIMPNVDGATTFRRIRELYPRVPVLLSSGYAINGQAEALLQSGCSGFIQKPYNIESLSRKIRAVLDKTRSSSF